MVNFFIKGFWLVDKYFYYIGLFINYLLIYLFAYYLFIY